jgi:hypothetical protein
VVDRILSEKGSNFRNRTRVVEPTSNMSRDVGIFGNKILLLTRELRIIHAHKSYFPDLDQPDGGNPIIAVT